MARAKALAEAAPYFTLHDTRKNDLMRWTAHLTLKAVDVDMSHCCRWSSAQTSPILDSFTLTELVKRNLCPEGMISSSLLHPTSQTIVLILTNTLRTQNAA